MVETVDSRSSNYDINQLAIKCPEEGDFISTLNNSHLEGGPEGGWLNVDEIFSLKGCV